MPKTLSEYSLNDFLHLRPLTQGMKTRRYKRVDEAYFKLPAPQQDLTAIRNAIAGKNVIITVAFDDREALAVQCALIHRYVDFDIHLVLDNSRMDTVAGEIRQTTQDAGALYVRLPENPWTGKNSSRSHGIAMNWGWHNILKPARPRAFGFVDHDLFPIKPVAPFALLAQHPFYGDFRWAGERWFLWAGYCVFDFEAMRDEPLDFGLDWFVGLDTGGANWDVLYRHTDPATLPPRPIVAIEALAGVPLDDAKFELRGEWIHEVGWGTKDEYREPKRRVLMAKLAAHLPTEPVAARTRNLGEPDMAPQRQEGGT